MDNELYEVSRDEYVGFLGQINPKTLDTIIEKKPEYTSLKVYSNTSKQHLSTRIVFEDGVECYYVFNMPPDEDRVPPKKIAKITLDDRKDVENFLKILSKLQKGEEK